MGRFLNITTIFLSALSLAMPGYPANKADETSRKKVELSVIEEEIDALSLDLKSETSKLQAARKQLKQADMAIAELSRQLEETEKKSLAKAETITQLEAKQARATEQLARHQDALQDQLKTAYVLGQRNLIKILLNQENTSELNRMMAYLRYFNRDRIALMTDLGETINEYRNTQLALAEDNEALQALLIEQQAERRKLQQQKQRRQALVDNINGAVTEKNKRLSHLESEKQSLEKVLKAISDKQRQQQQEQTKKRLKRFTTPDFVKAKGQLPWPTKGAITKKFGSKIEQSDLRFNGSLVKAPEGQSVYAVFPGTVVFSGWLQGFGLLVIIDHDDGYMTLYSRNNSVYKKVGDKVKAGDMIAKVGQSGGHSESGLYFEIRHNGQPENPELWCQKETSHTG